MQPVTLNPNDTVSSLREIERASHMNDLAEIAQAFSISGTFSATNTLNLTSPTVANVAAFLATLLEAMQKGGVNRTT